MPRSTRRSASACARGFAHATCRSRSSDPKGISILNILSRHVAPISADETGRSSMSGLPVGRATLTGPNHAAVVVELRIRGGQPMYALVKAVSFDRRSVGYA